MATVAVNRAEKVWVATQASHAQNYTNFLVADQVYNRGAFQFEQKLTTFPNDEKRNSRTRLRPVDERFPPGTWSMNTFVKDASAAGTVPEVDALLRAGVGSSVTKATTRVGIAAVSHAALASTFSLTNTVNRTNTAILVKKGTATGEHYEYTWVASMGATSTGKRKIKVSPVLGTAPTTNVTIIGSVTYSPAATTPAAVAILCLRDHTSFRITGGSVNQHVWNAPGEGPATIDWSGEFMRHYVTGTDGLASALAVAATQTRVDGSAHRFQQGSYFVITEGAKTEAVYVNAEPATNATATLTGLVRGRKGSTATAFTAAATITPWYPGALATAPTAAQGRPQAGFKGVCQVDGTDFIVREANTTYNNASKMATGEKNDSLYVTSFSNPGFREVTCALRAYFRQADAQKYRDGLDLVTKELVIPIRRPRNVKMVLIQMKQIALSSPGLSGEEEVEMAIDGTAFGAATVAAGNDEWRVAYIA